jgi:bifunctional non-homologous end joining protein LigD
LSGKWEKEARQGRARLDYTQNAINKTLVAPFSVRAAPGAPVSMPITWDDLEDPALRPDRWDLRDTPDHVARLGDPMARMLTDHQRLVPLT